MKVYGDTMWLQWLLWLRPPSLLHLSHLTSQPTLYYSTPFLLSLRYLLLILIYERDLPHPHNPNPLHFVSLRAPQYWR